MQAIQACRLSVTLFVACDAHRDFPDTAMKPCHILCTDGKVLSVSDFKQSEKQPIAVVFHVNHDEAIEGNGYAVYLWDLAPEAFADSIGVNQRTSADITALDGNENTFAIYDTRETTSPMAEAVFALWRYGQSSYIPSVAQMRMLYNAKSQINPIIRMCGGDELPDAADDCMVLDEYGSGRAGKGESVALFHGKQARCRKYPRHRHHKVRATLL